MSGRRAYVTNQPRIASARQNRVHTSDMSRRWQLGVVALVLVAAGLVVVVFVHRSHDGEDQRGALTPDEYAVALRWARSEVAKDDAQVSQAVATVGPRPKSACTSTHVVHVYLVGQFPHINLGGPGAEGPDMWMTIAVDPATDDVCAYGPSSGKFHVPAGAANLMPAL
jgi:hypothetical protein